MKKLLIVLLISPLFFNSALAEKSSEKSKSEVTMTKAQKKTEIKKLTQRLDEIRTLANTVQLTAIEKRDLRKEVQNIKEQLQKMEGFYLYLSLTTILIILLLIILL